MKLLELALAVCIMASIVWYNIFTGSVKNMNEERKAKDPYWKYSTIWVILSLFYLFVMVWQSVDAAVDILTKLLEGLK